MAGVLQGRRAAGLEALSESGPLKFTPELQLNARQVGVAGTSTVTTEDRTGPLLFFPRPDQVYAFQGVN